MHVIVVGAGVVGVTSAYWLKLAGHDVTLIEEQREAGQGVSAGNGGQLSYAYVEPLAGPELWAAFPRILLGLDSSVRMRPGLSIEFIRWGSSFLRQCLAPQHGANLKALLALALESGRALSELQAAVPLEFDHAVVGKLILYRDRKSLDRAAQLAEIKREMEFRIEILDRAQCLKLDAALEGYGNDFAGGVYAPEDAAGDCAKFTRALLAHLRERMEVEAHTSTRVLNLWAAHGRVSGVELDGELRPADTVVLANGIDAPRLAATVGLRLSIQPVKGYSLTAPAWAGAPAISLTDRGCKIVFARLGDRLRAAAYADLDGWSPAVRPERGAALLALARHLFPRGADWSHAEAVWAGQRPMTPSGLPLVGDSGIPGLYLNAGHGGLGWTLACGAAKRLAQAISSPR